MAKKRSDVYFTREIHPEKLIELYNCIPMKFTGKGDIIVKVHTGEAGNKNYLKPELLGDLIDDINGIVVETNTAYNGSKRRTNEDHDQLLKDHGWDRFKTDILDRNGDFSLEIPNGLVLKRNYVGNYMQDYHNCVVISHFKAHKMGGYGGALKQLSIGFASSRGKKNIHGYGNLERGEENLANIKSKNQDAFIKAMADAASSIVKYFKGNMIFINIMKDISTSCDCDPNAPEPKMKDIGMLISLDPVAIDSACLNLLYDSDDEKKQEVIDVIESKKGVNIIDYAVELGIGNNKYKLIEVE